MSGLAAKLLDEGFKNTLRLCLDEVLEEPLKILHVGGCRQRDFARYMAFLLPAAEIFVLDPDEEQVKKAREEICCRFKFVTSSVEHLPFEDSFFHLTLGHHLFEYVQDWEQAMAEIGRVTAGNIMLSRPRPIIWKVLQQIPGFKQALKDQGLAWPIYDVETNELLTHVNRYGKTVFQAAPFPWDVRLIRMRPIREERLILTNNAPQLVS